MERFSVHTTDRTSMVSITSQVNDAVKKSGVTNGFCYVFIPHTTAAGND